MIFVKKSSPYITRKADVKTMMLDVLIALLPTLIFAFVVYQLNALYIFLISIFTMILSEFVFVGVTHIMPYDGNKHSFKEKFKYAYKNYNINNVLGPLVSGVIYTLIMPAGAPLYAVFVGALFGIVVGKLVFGGLGHNIFNPAAAGMLFAKLCFSSQYNNNIESFYFTIPGLSSGGSSGDIAVGGTALGNLTNGYEHIYDYSLLDMFLGKMPGTLGEAFTITILIGAIYLVIRRSADFRIMLTYIVSFALMMLFAGICINSLNNKIGIFDFLGFELLAGGLFFGAVFMLTDPVTSPINLPGRMLYAIIAAIITVYIRLFGSYPEGVGFSILIANMMVPVIEYPKWSNPKFTIKNVSLMVGLFVVFTSIMVLVIMFGDKIAL